MQPEGPLITGHDRSSNWLRHVAVVLFGPFFLIVVAASPAQAHPNVLTTFPDAGFNSARSPEHIGLTFDEPVSVQRLSVQGSRGQSIRTTKPTLTRRGTTLAVQPTASLPDGVYAVRWQITAEDGDIVGGSFEFSVGDSSSSPASASVNTATVDPVAVAILRWLLFVGLSLGLGSLLGDHFVRDRVRRARASGRAELRAPRPWTGVGAAVGLVAVAGLVIEQIRRAGAAGSGPTFSLPAFINSQVGPLLVAELAGFAIALAAVVTRARLVTVFGLLVVVAAEGWRSHVHAVSGWLGSVTIGVHLVVASLWVGTLVHIVRTAIDWSEDRRQVVALFRRYIRYVLYGYLIVVATGTVAAILVLPSWGSLVHSWYGRILLAKIFTLVLVSALALGARRGLSRPISTFHWQGLRFARAERVALVAVLVFSALLTAVAPARPAKSALMAFPAPISGLAVYAGTLVGQVSTSLIASDGRVLVRLVVPDTGSGSSTAFQVVAAARLGNGRPTRLTLRPCGTGCFAAPVAWLRGKNIVDLNIKAGGWQGGRTSFDVPWPPQDGQQAFDRMRKAMTRQSTLVLTEHVTSNTQSSQSMSSTLTLTGREFLNAQPYRSGAVSSVTILDQTDRGTELGFALAAEGIYVRLVIDRQGRIISERTLTPNHLISRSFVYLSGH